jgi:hypothetical protein
MDCRNGYCARERFCSCADEVSIALSFELEQKHKARAVAVKTADTGVKDTLGENPAEITIPRC